MSHDPVGDILDDPCALESADSQGMLRALATAGAQVRSSALAGVEAGARDWEAGRPRSVLVASLGGSAAVADVLSWLAGDASPVPVAVRRNGPLPGWVGPLDLVVAVSVSGHARGPLTLAAEAGRRGSQLLTVGAPNSPLAQVCAQARGLHIPLGYHAHGSNRMMSSRTSLWSLLIPVLQGAHAIGVVDVPEHVFTQVADRLDDEADTCRPSSESFVNPAKVLATQLQGVVPVVLGDGLMTAVAARRAAAMLARTARTPAVHGYLPDDAGEVVATFDGPFTAGEQDIFADPYLDGGGLSPRLRLMLLRDSVSPPDQDEPADLARIALADRVCQMAHDVGVVVSEVTADPGHPLERLAGLIARTDFAAVYLALSLGIDPGLSPHVADLKETR
ncbi:MAG: SIS domain-containing protein [Actinomycetota bacterium]